jgi:hypothetical protein
MKLEPGPVIVARSSGLMCAARLISEDDERYFVKIQDNKRPQYIYKNKDTVQLFRDTDAAMDWIDEVNRGRGKSTT